MKIFSSLIAFAMAFACLSVAFADVALPPRPRPAENQFVTASINADGKLSVKFEFPYDCSYSCRLVDKNAGEEIFSDKGNCDAGDTVEVGADLRERLSLGENFFLLTIEMSDIKTQTRFGEKIRQDKNTVIKTVVVEKYSFGKPFKVRVYDGERD